MHFTIQEELLEEEVVTKTKKRNKRLPDQNAKDYEVGDQVVSENDNCTYEVIKGANRNKKWRKVKN